MHDEMKGVNGEMRPDYPSMELGKASTGLVAVVVPRGSNGADGWEVVQEVSDAALDAYLFSKRKQ